jgi:hypothetical protein
MRLPPGAVSAALRAKQDNTITHHDMPIPGAAPPAKKATQGIASCARCRGPLGSGTFCCRGCRRILCYAHVAVDDLCEDCYLSRKPSGTGSATGSTGSGSGLAPLPPPPPPLPRMPMPAPLPARPPGPPAPPTLAFDRDRVRRALDDTDAKPALPPRVPQPPVPPRPPGYQTLELPASEVTGQRPANTILPPLDADYAPTIAEIEALDMMPLLDTEKEEDAPMGGKLAGVDDDLARPPPGTSAVHEVGLAGLSFVCPHCDAPLPAAARACPKCRRAL